jgi:hypothetical protein
MMLVTSASSGWVGGEPVVSRRKCNLAVANVIGSVTTAAVRLILRNT